MTTCLACGYTRKPSDTAPGYRCPKCGQAYPDEPPPLAAKGGDEERKRPATVSEQRQADEGEPNLISPAALICRKCGTMGNAETQRRGSSSLEVFLYFFMLIPGIFYSIWRSSKHQRICRTCGNSDMIPVGTPAGRSLLSTFAPLARVSDLATPPFDEVSPSTRPAFRWALIFIIVTLALVSLSSGK